MSSLWPREDTLKGPPRRLSSPHTDHIQEELVNSGKKFQQTHREPLAAWLLRLRDAGVGPAPVGGLQVLLREVEGWHARHHCESVKTSERGPSLQGSHLGDVVAHVGGFAQSVL